MVRLAVIIPTCTRRDLLVQAVAACSGETIVVVDDSTDGMTPVSGTQWVRTSGRTGFARAVNMGLAAAHWADAALVLNDDAAPLPGCISRLAEVWTARGGIVGAHLVTPDGKTCSAGIDVRRSGRVKTRQWVQPTHQPYAVNAVSGACMLIGTRWRFDTAYPHGMEDIALCRQVQQAGAGVWLVPDAICAHIGGATLPARSEAAMRASVAGHTRLVGRARLPWVVTLATAQVIREGGPLRRIRGILHGAWDACSVAPHPAHS